MLQNIGQNVTVMTGDFNFNCTLNLKYDRASQVESHKPSADLLPDLVKELCLTDCYRHVNPTTRHNIRSLPGYSGRKSTNTVVQICVYNSYTNSNTNLML